MNFPRRQTASPAPLVLQIAMHVFLYLFATIILSGCEDLMTTRFPSRGPGTLEYHPAADPSAAPYYLYVPKIVTNDRVLVAVHGISRNAEEIADTLYEPADRAGTVLIVPVFDEENFHDFQRLGRHGRGHRADLALIKILDAVGTRLGIGTQHVFLYGNSGGGQFVHRFAMAHPERVRQYVISAPGWYTAPDLNAPFPYGFKPIPALDGVTFDIEKFLKIPACVLIGADDKHRDASLNQSSRVDTTQGLTRLARAKWWTETVTTAARWRGIDTRIDLIVMPGVGHDYTDMVAAGHLDRTVFDCLLRSN